MDLLTWSRHQNDENHLEWVDYFHGDGKRRGKSLKKKDRKALLKYMVKEIGQERVRKSIKQVQKRRKSIIAKKKTLKSRRR